MAPATAPRLHVLFTTGPAYGHISPLMELARKVSQHHDVTFAVSAGTIPRLTIREITKPSDRITYHPIEDGIEDDFDDPSDPAMMIKFFQQMHLSLTDLFSKIPHKNDTGTTPDTITSLRPVDLVIADSTCATALPACAARNIPCYLFHAMNATGLSLFTLFDETWPTVPDAEADPFMRIPKAGEPRTPIGEGMVGFMLPMRNAIAMATGHICNTSRDLEGEKVAAIERDPGFGGKRVYCVGPLLPDKADSGSYLTVEMKVAAWLARQEANSVVYVSFGSASTPSPDQLRVIGQALLATGKTIIWSLRDKYLSALPEAITAKIPGQFEDPANKFIVLNWVSQKQVLAHSSVAVFLSHCGWNSTLEAMTNGKPIVSWPMFADQLIDGELVEQLGTGVLIPGTGVKAKRVVPEQEIKDALVSVGGWNTGEYVKSKQAHAAEALAAKLRSAWLPGGSSHSDFSRLIKFTDMHTA